MIAKTIEIFGNYPDPTVLHIYPEGTRFTKEKFECSKAFALKNGLPLLKHHLLPRVGGFNQVIKHMDTSKIRYCI